jgi:predicted HTH transcriptional regulator
MLVLIQENSMITIKQLAEKVGLTERSIENNLQSLKKNGIIEREGAKKKGKWIMKRA